jgi:hypothetical protein
MFLQGQTAMSVEPKPSCGMALAGVFTILFVLLFFVWLVAGPEKPKEPVDTAIRWNADGNKATVCAAHWFRRSFDRSQTEFVRQSDRATAQASLNLGNGDKDQAMRLALSGRRIAETRSCANETITKRFDAEWRALMREEETASKGP